MTQHVMLLDKHIERGVSSSTEGSWSGRAGACMLAQLRMQRAGRTSALESLYRRRLPGAAPAKAISCPSGEMAAVLMCPGPFALMCARCRGSCTTSTGWPSVCSHPLLLAACT